MKIVINALQFKPDSSGIGVMIRDLFGALSRLTDRPCQVILTRDSPDFPAKDGTERVRAPFDHREGMKRMLFQAFRMGPKYCRDCVLLTTDSKTPFFLPDSCKLVPVITDLAVFRMPEVYDRSRVVLWRLQYRYIRRRADMFLAISEFTKSEMVRLLGVPAERVRVVPMACSERYCPVRDEELISEMRAKYALPERYVLFVGNNNPRKNLERTIRAFDLMKERVDLPHKLVIAGEQGWKFDRSRAVEGIRHKEDIIFTGFVPDGYMPALYSAADVFAFPTLYEGFGIPVLEAQRCGTPVVTSNVSALPEVAGDGAELVDPCDIESISAGLVRVLTDTQYAERLVERGYYNARRFSWEMSAEMLNETVEEVFRWTSKKSTTDGSGLRGMTTSPRSLGQ